MRCRVCGGQLESRITDLPFKVGDSSIVILRSLPVLQCRQCGKTLRVGSHPVRRPRSRRLQVYSIRNRLPTGNRELRCSSDRLRHSEAHTKPTWPHVARRRQVGVGQVHFGFCNAHKERRCPARFQNNAATSGGTLKLAPVMLPSHGISDLRSQQRT